MKKAFQSLERWSWWQQQITKGMEMGSSGSFSSIMDKIYQYLKRC